MLSATYQRRRVAPADARACFICYKPSEIVLVNEVPSADFFYACQAHLSDPTFAQPDLGRANRDAPPVPPKPALEQEIARLRREWNSVKSQKDQDKDKAAAEAAKEKEVSPSTEKRASASAEKQSSSASPAPSPDQRWFSLHPQILALRSQARQKRFHEKKTAQILSSNIAFPAAPTHAPGSTTSL